MNPQGLVFSGMFGSRVVSGVVVVVALDVVDWAVLDDKTVLRVETDRNGSKIVEFSRFRKNQYRI